MLKLVSKGQDLLGSLAKSGTFHAGGGMRNTGQVGAWLDSTRR